MLITNQKPGYKSISWLSISRLSPINPSITSKTASFYHKATFFDKYPAPPSRVQIKGKEFFMFIFALQGDIFAQTGSKGIVGTFGWQVDDSLVNIYRNTYIYVSKLEILMFTQNSLIILLETNYEDATFKLSKFFSKTNSLQPYVATFFREK